jgi:hypothetical protein
MNRPLATITASIAAAMLLPATASAATTIGQLPTPGSGLLACNAGSAHVQDKASGDASYEIPFTGILTRWRHQGGASGTTLALGVYERGVMATYFVPRAETPQVNAAPNRLNTFETRVAVNEGEVLAIHAVTAVTSCKFSAPAGNQVDEAAPAPAAGTVEQMYGNAQDQQRLNAQAVIEVDADGDGFGDESQDGCPADAARQDDCIGPVLTFGKTPKKRTSSSRASFHVRANEPLASLECAVDGQGFKACGSSQTLRRLDPRGHRFRVRATDASGNRSRAIRFSWRVR